MPLFARLMTSGRLRGPDREARLRRARVARRGSDLPPAMPFANHSATSARLPHQPWRTPGGNLSRPRCVRGIPPEPCREGEMTASHLRARSLRAGALLSAVAVLIAGCTGAGGGSNARANRAGPARQSVTASPPGRVLHRIATTPGPGTVQHVSGPGTAGASSVAPCAPPLGVPVTYKAGAASRLRVAVPACPCCRWCACAWACCGCGPGRWTPRSYAVWQCCPRWFESPDGDSSPIPSACGPGCRSFACPAGPQEPGLAPARSAAGSVQVGSPRA